MLEFNLAMKKTSQHTLTVNVNVISYSPHTKKVKTLLNQSMLYIYCCCMQPTKLGQINLKHSNLHVRLSTSTALNGWILGKCIIKFIVHIESKKKNLCIGIQMQFILLDKIYFKTVTGDTARWILISWSRHI